MASFRLGRWLGDFCARFRGARVQIDRITQGLSELQRQPGTAEDNKQDWPRFLRAIGLAARFGPDEIVGLVTQFGEMFEPVAGADVPHFKTALAVLKKTPPAALKPIEVALRIARWSGSEEMGELEQELCLRMARGGDANSLLARLFARHQKGTLPGPELKAVLQKFLEYHAFEHGWMGFFQCLPPEVLPRLHQVYHVLGRSTEAAEVAEAAGDFVVAGQYWMAVPGLDAARRALNLAQKIPNQTFLVAAHRKVAECLWTEGKFAEALPHFHEGGEPERASDCQRRLGQFAAAIQTRPHLPVEWLKEVWQEIEAAVQTHLAAREFTPAAQMLCATRTALKNRPGEEASAAGADQMRLVLSSVVAAGRTAFEDEVRDVPAGPETGLFQRWSRFEEAAENFAEAGVHAEEAGERERALDLYEKGGAFGQVLKALGPNADPARRAKAMEDGGDPCSAGRLYARIGKLDEALTCFENAGAFADAARIRLAKAGKVHAAFDDHWLKLLMKAGQVELLAALCLEQAQMPGTPAGNQARFYRRVSQLAREKLIEPKWSDEADLALVKLEAGRRVEFEAQAPSWAATATSAIRKDYLDSFGMDLGTSNCAVALFNKASGQSEEVVWRGKAWFPSVFAIDVEGREIVGLSETELFGRKPRAIVTLVKRRMGTDALFSVHGKKLRAEEISGRFINHAREAAREHLRAKIAAHIQAAAARALGDELPVEWAVDYLLRCSPDLPLHKAVITVPAYFNDKQKKATRNAASLVNVEVLKLIHEPTAACLSHRLGGAALIREEKLLVVDLGAGTLDLSFIIATPEGGLHVEAIEGDNSLGSSDLDDLLYTHFARIVEEQAGAPIGPGSLAKRRLRQACEQMKITLSTQAETTISLPHLLEEKTVELSYTRAELEGLARPWLERIQGACRKIKATPGLDLPDKVLIIGGGVGMPAVRQCVQEIFPQKPIIQAANPMTAVAQGAVIQAAILAGAVANRVVVDAVPFSLGIKSYVDTDKSAFDVMIRKHAVIPTNEALQKYTTVHDNQTVIKVQIFQGENSDPARNVEIGHFELDGIPMAKAGIPKIDVSFKIDANCLLTVSAYDHASRNRKEINISDIHLLSPSEMDRLKVKVGADEAEQIRLARYQQISAALTMLLKEVSCPETSKLQRKCQQMIAEYVLNLKNYAPSPAEDQRLLNLFQTQREVESESDMARDLWNQLQPRAQAWLDAEGAQRPVTQPMLERGEELLRHINNGAHRMQNVMAQYRQWINLIEGLEEVGDPDILAHRALRRGRFDAAYSHFLRLERATTANQVELGLEILARLRRRDEYESLFKAHQELLRCSEPNFDRLNQTVPTFIPSMVWIQTPFSLGSGFAINRNEIVTCKHVLEEMKDGKKTGRVAAPTEIRLVSHDRVCGVKSFKTPPSGPNDIAILSLAEDCPLTPLRLGFSELVQLGENVMTLGFPNPSADNFAQNLLCDKGWVNRITKTDECTEPVLQINIHLSPGHSGGPLVNELGEVVGIIAFKLVATKVLQAGVVYAEMSYYAVPVEVLRRLRADESM